jgi:hypothetical protein
MPPPYAVCYHFLMVSFSGTFIEFRAGMLNISPIGRLVDKFANPRPSIPSFILSSIVYCHPRAYSMYANE